MNCASPFVVTEEDATRAMSVGSYILARREVSILFFLCSKPRQFRDSCVEDALDLLSVVQDAIPFCEIDVNTVLTASVQLDCVIVLT